MRGTYSNLEKEKKKIGALLTKTGFNYQEDGQFVNEHTLVVKTRPLRPIEFAPLKKALEQYGFSLDNMESLDKSNGTFTFTFDMREGKFQGGLIPILFKFLVILAFITLLVILIHKLGMEQQLIPSE